jgi:hypothetical protein
VSLENRVDVRRGCSGAGLVSLENCIVMDLAVRRSVGAAATSAVFVVIVVGSGIENLIETIMIISFANFVLGHLKFLMSISSTNKKLTGQIGAFETTLSNLLCLQNDFRLSLSIPCIRFCFIKNRML